MSLDDSAGPVDPGAHLFAAEVISHFNGTKISVRLGIDNSLSVDVDGSLDDPKDTDRLIETLQTARMIQREQQRSQERRP